MAPPTLILLVSCAFCVAAPAFAETSGVDEARASAAEQAAIEADRAAAAAEQAMHAAADAARAARAAANAARAGAVPTAAASTPPADENLPVSSQSVGLQVFRSGLSGSVANGPNGATLKSSRIPDFQFLATADDKVASLAWTLDLSTVSRARTLAADQLTFTASSRFDGTGNAQPLGLKGFPNGAQVKVAYTHFGTATKMTGNAPDQVAVAEQRCLAEPAAVPEACDAERHPSGVSSFVGNYYPEGLGPMLDEVLPGNVHFYGVEFAGDQADYGYLDRAAFAEKSESHFGYSATLFGGLLLGRGTTSITGSYTWGRAYKAQGEITLCQPISGTIQTQCLTGNDGPPGSQDQSILSLELRHALPTPAGTPARIAIAPEFSADLESDAYSIVLPLYLVGDGEGKLRGGVQGVYLNEKDPAGGRKDSYALGVFVGVPFSIFSH